MEEYNKALELWVQSTRPAPATIHRMIRLIAKFLAEFSHVATKSPTFLRLGIDIEVMKKFGCIFDDVTPKSNSGDNDKDDTLAKKVDIKTFDSVEKEIAPQFPSKSMVHSKLYVYTRWIWMQFPWLALDPAAKVGLAMNIAGVTLPSLPPGKPGQDSAANKTGAGKSLAVEQEESRELSKSESQIIAERDNARMMKIWNNKKSDPTLPVFNYSKTRVLAAVKPRTSITATLERNVEVTYNKLYDEITAPSHIAKLKLGYHNPDKYRRTFEEEIELTKSLPFAYHSVKSMKHKSLFASYDASIREKQKAKIIESLDIESTSSHMSSKSSKKSSVIKFNLEATLNGKLAPLPASDDSNQPTFMLTQLDDEIRRLNNEEYMNHHSQKLSGNVVIHDEHDLEHETYVDRIARMKTIINKLHIIAHEKERFITSLANQVQLRRENDAQLIDTVQASEQLIVALNDRNNGMDAAYEEVRALAKGYDELLLVCCRNTAMHICADYVDDFFSIFHL